MVASSYVSWGRFPLKSQQGVDLRWADDPLPQASSYLPQGLARSYGDSCMNADGVVVSTRTLNRFISFDPATGLICCEAGVTLKDILAVAEPQGWFLAATPGTQYVTVGGAIANDVHGKNHHVTGSFGCHVRRLVLRRSDGGLICCSAEENADWFAATIGGLGMTGLIVEAELQLMRVPQSAVDVETIKYANLREFYQLSQASLADFDYTVAWLDCLATGHQLGRGHFMRANHAVATQPRPAAPNRTLSMPVQSPVSLVNQLSLRTFNTLYYHRIRRRRSIATVHYEPFFYPLDRIQHWNRMYGPRGFLQYQCVIPPASAEAAIADLLTCIARSGAGSFLVVLKEFGSIRSPGLMSFPRQGTTLALDFPWRGDATLKLFEAMDAIVRAADGALYPAKDARMRADDFQKWYPAWETVEQMRDPAISSSFWRRVTEQA